MENKYICSLVNLLYGLDFDKKCKGEMLPALRFARAQRGGEAVQWVMGAGRLLVSRQGHRRAWGSGPDLTQDANSNCLHSVAQNLETLSS